MIKGNPLFRWRAMLIPIMREAERTQRTYCVCWRVFGWRVALLMGVYPP